MRIRSFFPLAALAAVLAASACKSKENYGSDSASAAMSDTTGAAMSTGSAATSPAPAPTMADSTAAAPNSTSTTGTYGDTIKR